MVRGGSAHPPKKHLMASGIASFGCRLHLGLPCVPAAVPPVNQTQHVLKRRSPDPFQMPGLRLHSVRKHREHPHTIPGTSNTPLTPLALRAAAGAGLGDFAAHALQLDPWSCDPCGARAPVVPQACGLLGRHGAWRARRHPPSACKHAPWISGWIHKHRQNLGRPMPGRLGG